MLRASSRRSRSDRIARTVVAAFGVVAITWAAASHAQSEFEPHRIVGNVYTVGSAKNRSYLIKTTAGIILINSGYPDSANARTQRLNSPAVILAHLEKLGFKLEDVKILLTSHAHTDHAGGHAQIRRETGAQVAVMEGDDETIRTGVIIAADGTRVRVAEPCPVDRVLRDRDTVVLGDITLQAYAAPPHTPGATAWQLKVSEGGVSHEVLILESAWNISPQLPLLGRFADRTDIHDMLLSLRNLREVRADVLLDPHGVYLLRGRTEVGAFFERKQAQILEEVRRQTALDPAAVKALDAERERFLSGFVDPANRDKQREQLPQFEILGAAPKDRAIRIAVAHFIHETTTFSPEKVGIDDFKKPDLAGEALLSHGEPMQGFVKLARETAGVTLVPLKSPNVVIGSSSKGWIRRDAFEHYAVQILDDLKAALPVDAVYLSLHGAAAVEGVERPEAELARRVRALVGPGVPIAGTFDPHGNEDQEFLRYADFSFVMKYFPHYDGYLQGERAARLLIRTARGDYQPRTATRKPGIITPTVLQWTGQEPWISIVQRALTWEARHPDVYVSYFFGFPWSDVPDVGATFQVMTNGDQRLADTIAQDMSDYMWRRREELWSTPIVSPKKAVAEAIKQTSAGRTPIVLADYSDRTGDATHILKEIVEQDLGGVLYATLRDERTLAALKSVGAKAGDKFDREVGGYVIAPASGKPVRIRGKVVYFGRSARARELRQADEDFAVIEFGRGNYLVISAALVQVTDPAQMRWGPIDPDRFTTWVLKSRAHFRAGFDDNGYARTILIVDAPGPYLGTVHLEALPYKNVKLDQLFPYNAGGIEAAGRAGGK